MSAPDVSPVVRELPWQSPETAFWSLCDEPGIAWLDSATGDDDPRSLYSTIGIRPFRVIEAYGRTVTVDGQWTVLDPFAAMAELLASFRLPPMCGPTPFSGGLIGLLGYELGGWLERVPASHPTCPQLPDLRVGLFDTVVSFDHRARRCWIISSGFLEAHPDARRERAESRADEFQAPLVAQPPPASPPLPALTFVPDLSPDAYRATFRRLLDYIRSGDVFQANLTMRVSPARPGSCPPDPAIYLRLRAEAPSPFAAFLRIGVASVASVSPERFLRLDPSGRVETRPIKGTRRCDPDPEVDATLRRELAGSAKDGAENLMIVDVLRNDLGRIAEIGSVRVPVLRQVETFSAVHHLVSVIEAQLRPGLGAIDLLRATFPGGSVTGAPKIRAMEVIDELEASRREPYCGAVAIGFDGIMDSSIVIRTLVLTPDTITAQAGGGIVADSEADEEHRELWLKVAPLLRIFQGDEPLIWQDGSFRSIADARIAPDDRGFNLADGVFETVRLEGGRARHVGRHLRRLRVAALFLRIPLRRDDDTLADVVATFAQDQTSRIGAARLTLTRGPAPRGVLPTGTPRRP